MTAADAAATAAATDVAVHAEELVVAYGDHVALHCVSLDVPRGVVTAVIGPNGSGKTTLLKALSGLQRPSSGRIEVLGRPVGDRRPDIAHVLQATRVNDAVPLTVVEVVRMGRYARLGALGRFRRADHDAVAEAMDRMEVAHLASKHLGELSGGQAQRVFVAQGLAQDADVLLLDEPITGLDATSQDRIDRVLAEETAKGRTVLMTTHDIPAAARCDTVVLLASHLVAVGPPEQVLTEAHLGHAYGRTTYRTPEGTLVIGDPHVHGETLTGHEDHHHHEH